VYIALIVANNKCTLHQFWSNFQRHHSSEGTLFLVTFWVHIHTVLKKCR